MIDWISGIFGYSSKEVDFDILQKISPDGSLIFDKKLGHLVVGSHSSKIYISPTSPTSEMMASGYHCSNPSFRISGNPVKWLQGHNVYGSIGLIPLVRRFFENLATKISISDSNLPNPAIHLSRIDITKMIYLGDDESVHNWITTALLTSRTNSKSANVPTIYKKNMTGSTTVYWNSGSDRWQIKAYCKHCELAKNPPKMSDDDLFHLQDFSKGLLRIELTLKRKELTNYNVKDIDDSIFYDYWKRIRFNDMQKANKNTKSYTKLTSGARRAYLFWEIGQDVTKIYGKTSFYKFKKEIKEKMDIDISIPIADSEIDWTGAEEYSEEFIKEREQSPIPLCMQPEVAKSLLASYRKKL